MRYGYFDDQNREYVITQPETPMPWINYLGSKDFFGIISNTAGGYSFYKDARLRRVTRFRYNDAPLDSNGRYIYLRDDSQSSHMGSPFYWSPSWQPTRKPLDHYECRHGMGYTKIHSKSAGIESDTLYFVPVDENLEIWVMTIANLRATRADLSIFAAVEFCLWDAMDDATNLQRNLSIGEVEVEDNVIYHKSEYRERRDHFAFFTSSQELDGFDTQREAFLGAYRGWDAPLAVERGSLQNSIAHGWQPIGAQQIKISLQPGENMKIIFLLGYQENLEDEKFDPPGSQTINKRAVRQTIEHYLDPIVVQQSFNDLQRYWTGLLERFQIKTPNHHTNRMVNIWNPYQCMVTFNLSRSASYFETGIGRGMGFRDSNQDLLGFVHLVPAEARQRILDLAATQMLSGGAYHQYQPLTRRGNNEVGSDFNDDQLWLVLATAAYIKETGDWEILNQAVPFENQPGSETPLYDHLDSAIQFTRQRLGPHGLPLIGRADWNDCLNLNCFSDTPGQSFQTTNSRDGKIAESVFIAGLFVMAAREMAQIAIRKGHRLQADEYSCAAEDIERAVWKYGWDGEWFRRAYDNFGHPVGSKECDEGQIYIEPQGINVMAGLGVTDGRARQALDSVATHLATPHGIVLHQPAYSRYYLHLGEISSYPPGYKENAGIFCHTNPWVMIAETKIGRGDRALDYYLRINPSARESLSEVHRSEPYVYAQMIAGKDAPTFGEAKNSWLTGTAAWNYVAVTQWILGIRPGYDGLEIDPVLSADWDGYEASRMFRGVLYDIRVKRAGSGNEVHLEVDGRPVEGKVVPVPAPEIRNIKVNVRIGGK